MQATLPVLRVPPGPPLVVAEPAGSGALQGILLAVRGLVHEAESISPVAITPVQEPSRPPVVERQPRPVRRPRFAVD